MTSVPPTINLEAWVEANRRHLVPPVSNKTLAVGEHFIVQIVGGPNQRTDFHVDPYEEWFYQLEGDIHVNVMVDGKPETVHLRAGDTWLLPANVPHSPQRPNTGSVGLVIERVREPGVLERFQWYCPDCHGLVHESELHVADIVADLPPVFDEFYRREDLRTCRACGAVHPGRG